MNLLQALPEVLITELHETSGSKQSTSDRFDEFFQQQMNLRISVSHHSDINKHTFDPMSEFDELLPSPDSIFAAVIQERDKTLSFPLSSEELPSDTQNEEPFLSDSDVITLTQPEGVIQLYLPQLMSDIYTSALRMQTDKIAGQTPTLQADSVTETINSPVMKEPLFSADFSLTNSELTLHVASNIPSAKTSANVPSSAGALSHSLEFNVRDTKAFSFSESKQFSFSGQAESQLSSSTTTIVPAPIVSSITTSSPQAGINYTMPASLPLNSAEWQATLNQQLIMFSRNGIQNAEIRLHPQELGSLHIRLQVDNGQAKLQMNAHSHVCAVLESALPHLRLSMAENGLQLGQVNIQPQMTADTSASGFAQSDSNAFQQTNTVKSELSSEPDDISELIISDNYNNSVSVFV